MWLRELIGTWSSWRWMHCLKVVGDGCIVFSGSIYQCTVHYTGRAWVFTITLVYSSSMSTHLGPSAILYLDMGPFCIIISWYKLAVTSLHCWVFPSLLVFLCIDAELFRVHVPWPGVGEGVQHESHHTEKMAGKTFSIVLFSWKWQNHVFFGFAEH